MLIERLRVIDNAKIDTPQGLVSTPVTYSMDVAINEEQIMSVPISQDTYSSLHDIMTSHDPIEALDSEMPMGQPA